MDAEAIGMNTGGELVSGLPLAPRGQRPGTFAPGWRDTSVLRAGAIESLPAMAKAAAQPGTRGGKLTQAQLEAYRQTDLVPEPASVCLLALPLLLLRRKQRLHITT